MPDWSHLDTSIKDQLFSCEAPPCSLLELCTPYHKALQMIFRFENEGVFKMEYALKAFHGYNKVNKIEGFQAILNIAINPVYIQL
jgi:hypothetical protein